MKDTEQYFPVVLFIFLYKVVLIFASLTNSNETPLSWVMFITLYEVFQLYDLLTNSFRLTKQMKLLRTTFLWHCL